MSLLMLLLLAASAQVKLVHAGETEARTAVAPGVQLINGEELRQVIELNGPVKAALADWLSWLRPNLLEAWENYQFMRHLMWPHYEEAGLPEALPPETREYVPRVLAAAWLFMHPDEYRLEFPVADHAAALVVLQRDAALTELTICLGQEGSRAGWFRVLRNLNPQMDHAERQPRGTAVAIPAKLMAVYEPDCVDGPYQALAEALHGARGPAEPAMRNYVVKRGDTLSGVASQFRCATVRQLGAINKIPPPEYPLRIGQRLQLPNCS